MTSHNLFPDGKSVLNALLFDLRGHLTMITDHVKLLLEKPVTLTPEDSEWLRILKTQAEKWWEIEKETRRLCHPEVPIDSDWETISWN
jgi:hypothetical protein